MKAHPDLSLSMDGTFRSVKHPRAVTFQADMLGNYNDPVACAKMLRLSELAGRTGSRVVGVNLRKTSGQVALRRGKGYAA